MNCCAARTNGCLDLRCRAFPFDRQVGAEWSKLPGTVARCARDSVAPLRRYSANSMLASIGWLSAGVRRRHPVTVRQASLMTGSTRQVWALRHWAETHYFAVEWTRTKVVVRNVVAPAPGGEASKPPQECDAQCQLFAKWLEVPEIRESPNQCYSEVFEFGAKGQSFVVTIDFQLTFSFLVVEVEDCRQCFAVLSFKLPGLEAFTCGCHVFA